MKSFFNGMRDFITDMEKFWTESETLWNAKESPAQTKETLDALIKLTTDTDPEVITLRALRVYLTIVKHIKSGGSVKFIGKGPDQKLKVNLK